MLEALVEAERGRGRTHPNPIVGALVVSGRSRISASAAAMSPARASCVTT